MTINETNHLHSALLDLEASSCPCVMNCATRCSGAHFPLHAALCLRDSDRQVWQLEKEASCLHVFFFLCFLLLWGFLRFECVFPAYLLPLFAKSACRCLLVCVFAFLFSRLSASLRFRFSASLFCSSAFLLSRFSPNEEAVQKT